MHRPSLLFMLAMTLALPASGSAQSAEDRERERARIERERERKERDAQRAREREERDRERMREREERNKAGVLDTVVAFDGRGSITVSCPGGAVIITGSDKSELRVRARTESGSIRFTSTSGRATLEPLSGRGCSDGRFEVTVPVGTKVLATTWSGSVSVRGTRGDVEAHSQSGDVDVRDAGDRLEVETLAGEVTIAGVRGETVVNTVSGDVQLSGTRGGIQVETVSGDLDLRDATAKQVRAHTTSGDITFVGTIMEAGRYEFNTHSGDIGLSLPNDIGAELSVSTFNGGIESDFPITLKAGEHGIGAAQAKRLNFTVGRGTARIIAETFSGDITLRRRR
jgi:DUF4097 and DUF4098 domain-containing protein YvlB